MNRVQEFIIGILEIFLMSVLTKIISEWKSSYPEETQLNFRDLFRDRLHKEPYQLRYSLDKKRPNLFMIHPTDYSDKSNELVRECNGIILQMDTFSVVSYGMQTLSEISDISELDVINPSLENYRVEEAEDGTVLKIFYWNGEWIVSTNRRIDASRVKWSSNKTFYEMLNDAISDGMGMGMNISQVFDKDLDKNNTYSFILLHPENRLVIAHPKPELVCVGYRNNVSFEEYSPIDIKLNWARCPVELKDRTTGYLKKRLSFDHPYEKRGIIISDWSNVHAVKRMKMDYKWFVKANSLRKNMPSFHLSYLACSFEEKKLMKVYFGQHEVFTDIDNLLKMLTKYSFETYRDSYVRKQYKISSEHPIYYVVRRLHYVYKTEGEPIKMQHVRTILDTTPPYILDSMLYFFSSYGFYPPVDSSVQQDKGKNENEKEKYEENENVTATRAMATPGMDTVIVSFD